MRFKSQFGLERLGLTLLVLLLTASACGTPQSVNELNAVASQTSTPTPNSTLSPTSVPPTQPAPTQTQTPKPTILQTHTPVPPDIVRKLEAVSVTEDSITLQWKPPANSEEVLGVRYEVTRDVSFGRDQHHFVSETTFTDVGLKSGTEHRYRVRAISAGGVKGPEVSIEASTSDSPTSEFARTPTPEPTATLTPTSTPVATATPEPTALPTHTAIPPPGVVQSLEIVSVTETSITLRWKPPVNSDVHLVERYEVTRDVSFGRDEHNFVPETMFTDVGLKSGTEHRYRVRAIGAGGAKGPEISIEASTSDSPKHEPSPTPTPESSARAIQVSEEAKELAIGSISGYQLVEDAAIEQDGMVLSLVIVVGYAANAGYAKELGENFVRIVKTLSQDDPPSKLIGSGVYDYSIGVYRPNEENVALGYKASTSDRISWLSSIVDPTPTPLPTPQPTAIPSQTSTATWKGLVVAPENRCSPYDRDDYPYSQSVEQRIVAGMNDIIYGPYTGTYFSSTRETQIEHIVALSEAHDSGLCALDSTTRRRFAGDLLNLALASPSVNRQKGANDGAEWLPELNQCWFVDRVVRVRLEYNLTIDQTEADALEAVFSGCSSFEMVVVPAPIREPTSAIPTPSSSPSVDALAMWDDNRDGRITCSEAREHGIAPVRRGHPA